MSLIVRPAVRSHAKAPPEVRAFFDAMVRDRWREKGPRWDAEVVMTAATLAMHDAATTGRLSATARTALDRMWSVQRPDGGWDWLKCGWAPMESDDHYGVTMAALGVAMAPDDYASTAVARTGLRKIRRYLREQPAPSLHHEAMLLWVSTKLDGVFTDARRKEVLERLFALQRPDGGWATAALLAGDKTHRRKDDAEQDSTTSDGYATGLVIFIAREAGVPATDARLRRGVAWLEANQRESGRWFTRSPTKDSKHYIANAGTAFAVMALAACRDGETGR